LCSWLYCGIENAHPQFWSACVRICPHCVCIVSASDPHCVRMCPHLGRNFFTILSFGKVSSIYHSRATYYLSINFEKINPALYPYLNTCTFLACHFVAAESKTHSCGDWWFLSSTSMGSKLTWIWFHPVKRNLSS
jgi:hypothetical protein